jgi:hypothetical protein
MDTMRRATARQQAEVDAAHLKPAVDEARQRLVTAQTDYYKAYDRTYHRVYDTLKDK